MANHMGVKSLVGLASAFYAKNVQRRCFRNFSSQPLESFQSQEHDSKF